LLLSKNLAIASYTKALELRNDKSFPGLLIHGMNQLFSEVTKGFSGFLVKMVVSASGSLRLSGLSHGKFYFYYPLKLTRPGALAILTGSLPPVCYLLHRFLGSLGI